MYEYVGVEHWQKTTVFNLAKWKNGLAFRNINFSEIGRPVIKIAELKSGITGQTKFTDGEYDESVCVRKGDMLFSWSGNPDTSIDVFRWEGSDGWLNQHIYKVTPREGVDEDFLFFLLRWLRPRFAEIARNKQTTGLGHVTLQDFKNMAVGLPEISEQIAIVSFVRPIQDKIELNRRINKTLEATARAIFKDWFIDFGPTRAKAEGRAPYLAAELWDMFPDAFDDEGKPAGWNKKAMGELCEVAIGGLWGKDQSGSVGLKEYFCLRGVDLQHLRELGEAQNVPLRFAKGTAIEKRYVSINDVLIASSGAGPCGRSLWVGIEDFFNRSKDDRHTIYSNFVKRLHCKSANVACFLDTHLNEMRLSGEIQKYISGTSVPNLNDKGLLQSHRIILPSERLLDAFFEFTLIVQNHLFSEENASLAQTRDLLLPKLMSGEIRLREAEKVVEAVA